MRALPSLLVIKFLPPLSSELCLQLGGAMTLPLQYRLVSSGDPLSFSFCVAFRQLSFDGGFGRGKWNKNWVVWSLVLVYILQGVVVVSDGVEDDGISGPCNFVLYCYILFLFAFYVGSLPSTVHGVVDTPTLARIIAIWPLKLQRVQVVSRLLGSWYNMVLHSACRVCEDRQCQCTVPRVYKYNIHDKDSRKET